jgi:hypothetical protein
VKTDFRIPKRMLYSNDCNVLPFCRFEQYDLLPKLVAYSSAGPQAKPRTAIEPAVEIESRGIAT